jgi:hypothetical protein
MVIMHGDPAIKFKETAVAHNWNNQVQRQTISAIQFKAKRPIVANNGGINRIGTKATIPIARSNHAKQPNPEEAKQIQAQGARKARTSHGNPLFGIVLFLTRR